MEWPGRDTASRDLVRKLHQHDGISNFVNERTDGEDDTHTHGKKKRTKKEAKAIRLNHPPEDEATLSQELRLNKKRECYVRAAHLKLDDPFLGKAQVHALRVLQVEGTLVELRDRVVGVQQRRLLVHLADDLQEARAAERVRGKNGQMVQGLVFKA